MTKDGINLSQGQKQLVSIARAAISDLVLVLDEATSSIDTRTEKLIEKGMDTLMKDRTTCCYCPQAVYCEKCKECHHGIENGEIIERGDHEDLLDLKGRYYNLYTGMSELS